MRHRSPLTDYRKQSEEAMSMSIDEIDAAYSPGGETTRMTRVMGVDEIAETYGRGNTESQPREPTPVIVVSFFVPSCYLISSPSKLRRLLQLQLTEKLPNTTTSRDRDAS